MWFCTFRASFRNSREYSSAPSASLVADQRSTYVARGQLARSPKPARIIKDSRGGRTTFADGVTQPPSLLEADAGLDCLENISCHGICVYLHPRMSAHNYRDAPRAYGMVSPGLTCRDRTSATACQRGKGIRNRN